MNVPDGVGLCPLAWQILAYLSEHPTAQDTLEGITEWWLLEQRMRVVMTEVKKALVKLVAQGLVLERAGRDGRLHFRLNPRKKRTVARRLGQKPSDWAAVPPAAPVESIAGETTRRR